MAKQPSMQSELGKLAATHSAPKTEEKIHIPTPSLKERDRRHARVRRAMAREGIDVLICPANHSRWDQMMADSRYLTAIGGYGTETLTVFPLKGEVTAGVFNRSSWWKRVQDWTADVRDCRNRWAELIVERLHELEFPARGRIAISGMAGLVRAPDGLVPYTTIERLRRAFPEAHLVDATALMQDLRTVKSAEEIRLMARSVSIIEKMLDAMTAETRPGVTEKHLFTTLTATMLANGGELPSLMIMGSGQGLNTGQFVPTDRVVKPGDMVVVEAEAHHCGYSGQVVQPVSVGTQPAAYMTALDIVGACFDAILGKMKPGNTLGDLMDTYEGVVARESRGKLEFLHPMMHARGLGDERPAQFGEVGLDEFRRIPLEAGMTFVLKPRVRDRRNNRTAQLGDTVVVTRAGGKRLGSRELALRVV